MKLQNVFPISTLLLVALFTGCSSKLDSNLETKTLVSPLNSILIAAAATVQSTIDLGLAGNFDILSESVATDVYKSAEPGNVGSIPLTGATMQLTCPEVLGTIYSVNDPGPLLSSNNNPIMLTTAVSNMRSAYMDAAGRINPDYLNLGEGSIGNLILTPGLYKWTSNLNIPTDVTISGGPNDIFIFQVDGTLTMVSAVKVTLTGGVQAKNIFWQVAGAVNFGTTSHFEGNILGKTDINLQNGATINGKMLALSAVTLEMNTVAKTL